MSGGGGASSTTPSFDLEAMAIDAISLGMSLEEFDRLDFVDIPLVFKGLVKRYEREQEGTLANLLRIGFTSVFNSSGFVKKRIKDLREMYRFSYEKEIGTVDKKAAEIFAKLYHDKHSQKS